MTKSEIIRKLSSRKFWVCLCGFVSSVMAMLRYGDSETALVTSLITSAGCLVAYILSEGYVDAASAGKTEDSAASTEKTAREWKYEDELPWQSVDSGKKAE